MIPSEYAKHEPVVTVACVNFTPVERDKAATLARMEANFLGHRVICGPAFPRFSHVSAEGGDTEEIVSATLNFERLHRWDAVYPWRQWRRERLKQTSGLIAREFQELA